VYAAAADADSDARAWLEAGSEIAGGELGADCAGDIGDLAIGELLANYKQAGKLHDGFILTY